MDEASKYHIAEVIKEGHFEHEQAIGNVDAQTLCEHYLRSWARYFGHPRRIHVDAEAGFDATLLKQLTSPQGHTDLHLCRRGALAERFSRKTLPDAHIYGREIGVRRTV